MQPDAEINKVLFKINEKVKELRTNNLAPSHQKILKTWLQLIWGEDASGIASNPTATQWRKSRARKTYLEIQEGSEHLFLSAVLVIPPTACSKKSIDKTLNHLLRIKDYSPFHLNLSSTAKMFFKTTAVEQGFSADRRYLKFMRALFPQS
jgi:hypothetical protein